jgi:hypothetical protein
MENNIPMARHYILNRDNTPNIDQKFLLDFAK